jgi:hypothetical protein
MTKEWQDVFPKILSWLEAHQKYGEELVAILRVLLDITARYRMAQKELFLDKHGVLLWEQLIPRMTRRKFECRSINQEGSCL